MQTLRWPFAAISLIAAGLLFSVIQNSGQIPTSHARAEDKPPAPEVARADEVSSAFRYVARKALPAVVSIEAIGKPVRRQVNQPGDSFGSDPFSNHPFFRDFFERIPRPDQGSLPENRLPEQRRVGQGSGFIFDSSGIIMTNAHVVRGAEEVKVQLSDGRVFTATDIKTDDRADVAVIRIQVDEQLPYLAMGNDEEMEIGDWVLAFGSPFGLHRTVTQGIISAKSRGLNDPRMRQEFLQTDAAINPGNSGGPLVNLDGEVIGINTAISTSSGGYDGVGFAVPISLARWVGEQLTRDGRVRRAYVGVVPQDINADIAAALNLGTPRGVLVAEVTKDSPADRAGLQIQDVILELDGQLITNSRKLVAVAEKLNIGSRYRMVILRDGSQKTIELTVAEFPDQLLAGRETPAEEPTNGKAVGTLTIDELGVDVQPLSPELAEQLGTSPGQGVVVTNVQRGSLAARIGLQPGNLILRIGNTEVNSLDDVAAAVIEARKQRQVLLFLKTPNGSQFISVPFGNGQ